MRIISLFSGYGGLDLAALQLFPGASTAWHCEWEPAPSKILAHHWPDVPNLHDVTQVDWATVEPIDILTGGYPCQPFSAAGLRKGTDDERHLWPYVRAAIRHLRPRFALLENVAGHRSMGFDRVLGDCAEDGLHVRWASVRASDVGACHRRERLFILVTPDAGNSGPRREADDARGRQPDASRRAGGSERNGSTPPRIGWAFTPDAGRDRREGGSELDREPIAGIEPPCGADAYRRGDDAVALLPTPRASDGTKGGPNQRGSSGDLMLPSAVMSMLPTPSAADGNGGGRFNSNGHQTTLPGSVRLLPTPEAKLAHSGPDYARIAREGSGGHDLATAIAIADQWGEYGSAIRRQESLSRSAPSPTEPNSKGNPRLSAAFAEWMMMLPAGWVTDPAIGLSRADQLKAIGNGVVPAQAIAAFRHLLSIELAVAS